MKKNVSKKIILLLIVMILVSIPVFAGGARKLLMVNLVYNDTNLSDSTQIRNALENGGGIFVNMGHSENFPYVFELYGATDAEGYFNVLGAFLNYVASYDWELKIIDHNYIDDIEIGRIYYFEKD